MTAVRQMNEAASQPTARATRTGMIYGLVAVLFFGMTLPATKLAVAGLDPLFIALGRAMLAAGLAAWAGQAVDAQNGAKIAVAGGCAMNAVLMTALRRHLEEAGLTLLEARQAPPNDGGLAHGQAWLGRKLFKEMKNVSGNSRADR